MKIKYIGSRSKKDYFNIKISVEINEKSYEPLNHIQRHSCDMDWSMNDGAKDLALSILVDYLIRVSDINNIENAKKALKFVYMDFKENIVETFNDEWEVEGYVIEKFLKKYQNLLGIKNMYEIDKDY